MTTFSVLCKLINQQNTIPKRNVESDQLQTVLNIRFCFETVISLSSRFARPSSVAYAGLLYGDFTSIKPDSHVPGAWKQGDSAAAFAGANNDDPLSHLPEGYDILRYSSLQEFGGAVKFSRN